MPTQNAQWSVVADAQILAVHAALQHTGYIVYFGGNQWNIDDATSFEKGGAVTSIQHSRAFDCASNKVVSMSSPKLDVFCSGHAFLPDGNLLVAGGTATWFIDPKSTDPHAGHWSGLRNAWILDTIRNWNSTAQMHFFQGESGGGRWYPTLVALASGDVLAMCGHPHTPEARHNNNTPEIFHAATHSWKMLDPIGVGYTHDYVIYYPRMHVLPHTGNVLIVNPLYTSLPTSSKKDEPPDPAYKDASLIFAAIGKGSVQGYFPGPQLHEAVYNGYAVTAQATTSVLLPLLPEENYHARVLLCGGNNPLIADLQQRPASWKKTSDRALAKKPQRLNLNAVLLPDGTVFICGGMKDYTDLTDSEKNTLKKDPSQFDAIRGVMEAELYTPPNFGGGESWAVGPRASVPRGYHSVALLMPDGRVWTAGSNKNNQVANKNIDTGEHRIEVFAPEYYFKPRSEVSSAPSSVVYSQEFIITTNQASSIKRVAIIRCGSVTHAFNSDQRYVGLRFKILDRTHLQATAPPNGTIAPPGWYLLFLLDGDGIPSVGKPVSIGNKG